MKKRYVVNFPGHMADCEFNYRRLRRLMPGWPSAGAQNNIQAFPEWRYFAGADASSELIFIIRVKEFAKYTTTVHIVVDTRLQNPLSWVKKQAKAGQKKASFGFNESPDVLSEKANENACVLKGCSMDVRLYHDATVAEVITCQGMRRFQPKYEYPNRKMFHRDEKSQLNRFLGELLAHCLAQGRVTHNVLSYS